MTAWKAPQFILDEYEWLGEQRVAAADPSTARTVVVGFGRCVVHGLGDEVPQPSVAVAVPGAETFLADLEREITAVPAAMTRWQDADDSDEAEDIVVGLLELRMECWYAAEGLERVAETAGEAAAPLRELIVAIDTSTRKYDERLEENLDVLSTIVDTLLLKNWRAMLPPMVDAYEPLPWWLDGTLELEAIRDERQFVGIAGILKRSERDEVLPATRVATRHQDDILRGTVAALAAAPAAGDLQALSWTLPGTPLRATLMIPPDLSAGGGDSLTLDLEDTTGGNAALVAVGSLAVLNGVPICWSLGGSAAQPDVRAVWPWTGEVSALTENRTLSLIEAATGVEWVAEGRQVE